MIGKIGIKKLDPYIDKGPGSAKPEFTRDDYMERIELLLGKARAHGLTHILVYGDREHFANLDYLTGYDPRFEESLLIIRADGDMQLLVGNEGYAYSFISPVGLKRTMYQNFSLQGQPRDDMPELRDIFGECGIGRGSRIGMIGFKFFDEEGYEESTRGIDIPSYIVEEAARLAGRDCCINFTWTMTHLTHGIRMKLRKASEIAVYEYACNKASNCVINVLGNLRPGISELEASRAAGYDASPISMFPIVNFGEEHVRLGLRSPDDNRLHEGDLITICYGIRGSLVARSGFAAYGIEGMPKDLRGSLDDFYIPYFRAIAEWYGSIKTGASCGDIYTKVMSVIGDPKKFGVALNPGHYIGGDEWVNSPFFKGSGHRIESGSYFQCDIIASAGSPLRQAILEDGIIIADKELRERLGKEYPETYARIMKRRDFMRDSLGIPVDDDVLPLSNAQAVLHPFMLDRGSVLAVLD